jgi:signal transduction histidine kinase/CheY-like chemotaxis protein
MKRYVGFTADDAATLMSLAPMVEPHLGALADRFYEQIPRHSEAVAVFTGGEVQIARLKLTLQRWARSLFCGAYGEAYAQERFRIGYRHVQIALPQRYVISAMHVVARFLGQLFDREIREPDHLRRARASLERIISLDLGLICDSYFEGSLRELRLLNDGLTSANRSLEEANRVKADFLATTSHELRTPLTSIIGFSRILMDGYISDTAEQRDLLGDVHRSALHLLSLVDDILDLSRIEAGRLDISVENVDLAGLIAEVVTLTKVQANENGLALVADLPNTLPRIRVDRSRMRQILLNVIGNAIKFTDRGEIAIRAAATDGDSAHVRVNVADTGIGIALDKQPLLFEKFRQLDATHTRRHGGSGLGLAISKALIERMGGRIELRSAGAGMGTTVALTVPVAKEAPLDAASSDWAGDRPRRSLVLLMEDADARKAVASSLKSRGHVVREGATADGVRALVQVERPDVLLIDLTTAGSLDTTREWLDLLVALHADPQTRSIRPVVLIDREAHVATRVQLELLPISPTILDEPLDGTTLKRLLARLSSSPRATPVRVLVGDDDPLVFKFVMSVLPPDQYIVQHAATGAEVLRAVDAQHFDALLLDLRMPDQSGYDVIRSVKLEGRAPDLPILVITNYPKPADEREQMLLSSPLVLEVLAKSAFAARPECLVERLDAIRRDS